MMTDPISSECPEPGVLVQFLRGKLHPPQLDSCELHLKDCQRCHETLAGLNDHDTLTERLVDVMRHGDSENGEADSVEIPEDSAEIQNLLDRLTSDDFKRSAMAEGPEGGHRGRTAQMEIVADRAAEILRCVTPNEDSLGILGDYKLIQLIGAGSTGVVFKALDQTLTRAVALKVLRPSLGKAARTRFLTEAKLAASIEHVNVVTIFQVGQVDRLAYMAMQWVPGQTLESLLDSGEELDRDQIVEIIQQVAAGLSAAHQKQLVHRDIKPANLWICEKDRQLKILDFGLARINDGNHNLTATGMLAGTPGFMSPEQTRGQKLDGRSDLFSLGCVMYRLLTGQLPFGSPTILATLSSIQSDDPAAPTQINSKADQDLSDLAMCLLQKQPDDRPQSAAQVIELLTTPREQWSLTVPDYSNPLTPRTANSRPQSAATAVNGFGRKWPTGIPATIGLLMLGVVGWLFGLQIIRVVTDRGEIVIETSDDNVEVQVLQDGKIVRVIDTQTQQAFSLKSGEYSFNAVATDSAEVGQKGNSFTIEPAKLTMKRGESVIVSVTAKPIDSADPQVASVVRNEPVVRDKPVYEGNTFDQWINILRANQDHEAQFKALEACLAIMETEQEQKQILDGARVFMKTLDSKFGYSAFSKRSFLSYKQEAIREKDRAKSIEEKEAAIVNSHELILRVLESCDQSLVFEFFKAEIEGETRLCQHVFWNWLRSVNKRRDVVWDRYTELVDPFAENFDKPLVRAMANILLPAASRKSESLTRFQGSALGIKVRTFVQTATPGQRLEVLKLAFGIFPDDQQVLQTYQKDLLDPKLNDVFVNLRNIGPRRWTHARTKLFLFMCNSISNKTYFESPVINATLRQQRVATVADWLAKVVDGHSAAGDQRLDLAVSWVNNSDGTRKIWALHTFEVTAYLLQGFYDVGSGPNDPKIKQRLLAKLETLKESIVKGKDEKELTDHEEKKRTQVLADLNYVIAVYQDNAPAELPVNSNLRLNN